MLLLLLLYYYYDYSRSTGIASQDNNETDPSQIKLQESRSGQKNYHCVFERVAFTSGKSDYSVWRGENRLCSLKPPPYPQPPQPPRTASCARLSGTPIQGRRNGPGMMGPALSPREASGARRRPWDPHPTALQAPHLRPTPPRPGGPASAAATGAPSARSELVLDLSFALGCRGGFRRESSGVGGAPARPGQGGASLHGTASPGRAAELLRARRAPPSPHGKPGLGLRGRRGGKAPSPE